MFFMADVDSLLFNHSYCFLGYFLWGKEIQFSPLPLSPQSTNGRLHYLPDDFRSMATITRFFSFRKQCTHLNSTIWMFCNMVYCCQRANIFSISRPTLLFTLEHLRQIALNFKKKRCTKARFFHTKFSTSSVKNI